MGIAEADDGKIFTGVSTKQGQTSAGNISLPTPLVNNVRKDQHILTKVHLLASSIESKLTRTSPFLNTCSIFQVLPVLSDHNPQAYVKMCYLSSLLSRISSMNVTLTTLIQNILMYEDGARACYGITIPTQDMFVEMMIVDGCFIVEFLRKVSNKDSRDKHDPVFNMPCMIEYIRHDLLLLENQIPWFILQNLFHWTNVEHNGVSLHKLVVNFYNRLFSVRQPTPWHDLDSEVLHILHFIRELLISPVRGKSETYVDKWELIPCVTRLLEAGVKYQKSTSNNILDIEFSDGVLKIPTLGIHEMTEPIFRNLIAFEQCYSKCTHRVTSYAILLDCLIDSSKDVEFLSDKGIIDNWLSSETASKFFNKLYDGTYVQEFYYAEICKKVNDYYSKPWNKWRATLRRDYFQNPWSALSCIAAVILLVLTTIQIICSIMQV